MIKQDVKNLSVPSLLVPLLKLILCLIIAFTMLSCLKVEQAIAENELALNLKNRIEGFIGAGGVNRIQVIGSEIMEVVGDESKYSLYWSNDWRNLFITPKTEIGETVDISLILVGGQAQDMRLTVGDVTAQTIFLQSNNSVTTSSTSTSSSQVLFSKQLKLEIASMMRAMIEDVKNKYYVNILKRSIKQNKEILITQSKSYRYKDLSGAVLSIKNLTSKAIALEEECVSSLFKGVIAINLPVNLLPARSKVSAFIITRDNREER